MAEDRIRRKNLWQQLHNVNDRKTWIKAVQKLGLNITQPSGGTSHQYAVRLKGYENTDIKGHLFNIYEDRIRKDVCRINFKILLEKGGFKEDDIWKALGML
jgi:hypothetical protein